MQSFPGYGDFLAWPAAEDLQRYADIKALKLKDKTPVWSEANLREDILYNWVRSVKSETSYDRPYHSGPVQFLSTLTEIHSTIKSDIEAKSLDIAAYISIFNEKKPWDPPECGNSAVSIAKEGIVDLYYSKRIRHLIHKYKQDSRFQVPIAVLAKWLEQEKTLRNELDWLLGIR